MQPCYYLKDFLYSNKTGHLPACCSADIIVSATDGFSHTHTHIYLNTHIHGSILTALRKRSALGLQGSSLVFTENGLQDSLGNGLPPQLELTAPMFYLQDSPGDGCA